MLNWRRKPWMALVALSAVLAVAGGCSDDEDDDNENGELVVRDGTWNQSISGTFSGTDKSCVGSFGPDEEMVEVCDLNEPDDIPGSDGCEFSQDGNEVEIHCAVPLTLEGCTFTDHIEGHATFEETTYTMVLTTFTTVSPASPACLAMEFADPCTTTSTITGTWVNATGCEEKGSIPVGDLIRAAARRVGSR